MRRPSVIALIAITIVFVASTLPANAVSNGALADGPITLIALDEGVVSSPTDLDMAETALMTLAGGLNEGNVAVTRYGVQMTSPVVSEAGPAAVDNAASQIAALKQAQPIDKSDQFAVLTAAYSYFTQEDAAAGSRVVLVTSGRIRGESENTRARLRSVGDLYENESWTIDVATMPTTEAALRDLLRELADSSGGSYFDLGTPEGLFSILYDAAGVDLSTVVDTELNGAEVASTFEVAPLTESASVAFLRHDEGSSVSLFKPGGTQVTSQLENVSLIESPNVVIFNVSEPVAGTWTVKGQGERGKLVTGVEVRSPLTVGLVDQPPLPVGEPGMLTAAATIDGVPQVVPGTQIEATVRLAEGSVSVYELNDEGIAGDASAGDGIFSVRLPAPEAQGINDVGLNMRWEGLKSAVTGTGSYKTEVFPVLRVTRMFDVEMHEGSEATVATIETFVGEFPYLASPSEFEVKLVSLDGEFSGRVQPRSEPEPGKGFAFDVLASVPASGDYSVTVSLNTEYLGRSYMSAGPAISTNALITPEPFLIFGLPVWALGVIVVVAVTGLALVVIQSRRLHPYGFIYDDQDRLVVDFASLRRSWLRRLTASDSVKATEVPGLPFRGGAFKFTRGGVHLEYKRDAGDPSIRVNSRPAAPVVALEDDTWLGVAGRLLSFVRERRPRTSLSYAPADD